MIVVQAEKNRPSQKSQLFGKALPYFIVAIASMLREHCERTGAVPTTPDVIQEAWTTEIRSPNGRTIKVYLLDDDELFDAAIAACADVGLIDPLIDEFAPLTYLFGKDVGTSFALLEATYPIFETYRRAGPSWLYGALEKIMEQRAGERSADKNDGSQGFLTKSEDQHFLLSDESEVEKSEEWRPLSLNPTDPGFVKAEEALDAAIEAVRADNRYGADHPEEKQWALDSLRAVSKRLKEDTHISVQYIKLFALQPLGRLVERCGNAVHKGLGRVLIKDSQIIGNVIQALQRRLDHGAPRPERLRVACDRALANNEAARRAARR